MEVFWTIELALAYGCTVQQARHLNDEEKTHYVDSAKETTFLRVGKAVALDEIRLTDMPERPSDGDFPGCGNQAWMISEEEKDAYLALNAQRREAKQLAQRAQTRQTMQLIIAEAERQGGAVTREEAKRREKEYNATYNEGGYGYVPHWITVDELEKAKAWLEANPE